MLAAGALVALALLLSRLRRLRLERELAVAALRALVQLAAVALVLHAAFERLGLSALFLAVMLGTASWTSGRRLAGVPRPVPLEAAQLQLTVLLSLLGAEVLAAVTTTVLVSRAFVLPGERLADPAA